VLSVVHFHIKAEKVFRHLKKDFPASDLKVSLHIRAQVGQNHPVAGYAFCLWASKVVCLDQAGMALEQMEQTGYGLKRIRFIDGLRGLSIILVFIDHWASVSGSWVMDLWLGNIGVEIFFILSGYLIASILNRKVFLFYAKRILRIFPVYFFYLITCILITGSAVSQFILPLTFTTNLEDLLGKPAPWSTSHFWTLAVEEQFYLLSPLLLFIRKGWVLKTLFAGIIAFFIWEAFYFSYLPEVPITYGRALPIVGFFGILNGILITRNFYRTKFPVYFSLGFMGIYILLMATAPINKNLLLPLFSVGFSFLFQYLLSAESFLRRMLENKLVVGLGVISYSFYVFHLLVIHYCTQSPFTDHFLAAFCLAVIVAIASYFGIEKPFQAIRKRFLHHHQSGTE
jgi:peptidoglycan/LPS O-acetylase OafA/YrhL